MPLYIQKWCCKYSRISSGLLLDDFKCLRKKNWKEKIFDIKKNEILSKSVIFNDFEAKFLKNDEKSVETFFSTAAKKFSFGQMTMFKVFKRCLLSSSLRWKNNYGHRIRRSKYIPKIDPPVLGGWQLQRIIKTIWRGVITQIKKLQATRIES